MTKYDKQPKTILLENGGLLSDQCEAWMDSIDDQYVEINSEVNTYMRSDDLQLFAMFTHPNLKTIATSSAFPTIMPYEDMRNIFDQLFLPMSNVKAFIKLEKEKAPVTEQLKLGHFINVGTATNIIQKQP